MHLTFQMMTLENYLTKNFELFFRGYPLFGPSKCGVSKNDHPSTAYDPTFLKLRLGALIPRSVGVSVLQKLQNKLQNVTKKMTKEAPAYCQSFLDGLHI